MTISPAAPPASKPAIRIAALAARDAIPAGVRAVAAATAARLMLPLIPRGALVALYSPIRSEMDTMPLAQALREAGHALALPLVTSRAAPLAFHAWQPGEPLHAGFGGILQPGGGTPLADPDTLIVPLAAFDRRLHRLGYGAGFYDRALAALRAERPRQAIGLAFAAQEVAALPDEPHDVALDAIVTERCVLQGE
jgi:5-formyltetrahydrofolate cyclo-ligase